MKHSHAYGGMDRFLHWSLALTIIGSLIFSYGMSALPEAEKPEEYADHGLAVTTTLVLMLIRLGWRLRRGFAPLPEAMPMAQKAAARFVHYAFYVAIFYQLIVGLLLASTTHQDFVAGLYGINYSALDLAPDEMHESLLLAHKAGFWAIVSLLVVHVLAALKHHFIDRDRVLIRMLPFVGKHRRNQA